VSASAEADKEDAADAGAQQNQAAASAEENTSTVAQQAAKLFDPDELTKELNADTASKVRKPEQDVVSKSSSDEAGAEAPSAVQTVLSSKRYILELGSFETRSGAERLQEALNSVGFASQLVEKTRNNRKMYDVQQGPFESETLAQASKQRLQKRGITSVLRQS